MELTKELKEKVGKAENMEEEKKTDRSPQVGEGELDKVAGGIPDTMMLGWSVLGNEKEKVQCWQCRNWFIYTRKIINTPFGYFCSEKCYQEYLNKDIR